MADDIQVRELFPDEPCRTRIWLSDAASEGVYAHAHGEKHRGSFLKKLKRYAMNGFDPYIGDDRPIRHEWKGVFRIGDSSLFRLIGFFGATHAEFIGVDAFVKRGQELSPSQRKRIDWAARVKEEGRWVKV